MVVAAPAVWAVVTYVWPANEAPKAVCAQQGGVAAGRDASRNTVNYNGAAPGNAGSVACVEGAKK